jgi:hypothetical protein
MRKADAPPTTTNTVQYISRLKFFGLPFHAAYPIAAAIVGTTGAKHMPNADYALLMRND